MEKPLVVTLGTGFVKDEVEYVENGETKKRMGLCKRVSTDFLQQPFRDLVSYMCDPNEDEYNSAYTPSETELSQRIGALISQDDVVLQANKTNNYQVNDITLETLVGDKYAEIKDVKEINDNGQMIPVNSLDLIVMEARGGGFYRYHV